MPAVNYTPEYLLALGEHTLHSQAARQAAHRRHALLHNLAQELTRASKDASDSLDIERLRTELSMAQQADQDMRSAIKQANTAAPLCGQAPVLASSLLLRD